MVLSQRLMIAGFIEKIGRRTIMISPEYVPLKASANKPQIRVDK